MCGFNSEHDWFLLLDESDGELAPAIMRALAYADCIPTREARND